MSRSYGKTLKWWPAHARTDQNLKRYGNKSLRMRLKAMRDEEDTPILPYMVSSRASSRWFGGNTYDRRVYQFRVIGGKLVSTSDSPEPFPGYRERKFRHYRCK